MQKNWRDFKSLYGNIEGARDGFEDACQTLFDKVYPDKQVSKMAVKQGDGGIDICIGELGVEPVTVIQCKFFLETFGASQKSQIKKSFTRAITSDKYELDKWILCIPREIDIDETSWWAKWKNEKILEYSQDNEFISLQNGIHLIDLMKEYNVYNQIFQMQDSLRIEEIYKVMIPPRNHEEEVEQLISDENFTYNKNSIKINETDLITIESVTVDFISYELDISIYPVTYREYDLYCDDIAEATKIDTYINENRDKYPIVNITIEKAVAYCEWLSKKDKKTYYRLPVSNEWEIIASKNIPKNNFDKYIWYKDNSNKEIHQINSKRRGLIGIYHLFGNIEEICSDYVTKGYAYDNSLKSILNIKKSKKLPSFPNKKIGFRIVKERKESKDV